MSSLRETPRILLVEDDPATRMALHHGLRREGWQVIASSDAREAIRLLRQTDFSVVLTDLRLPNGDGVQVMEAARGVWPETEVILLTAYGTLESAVKAVREGAFDYILKPAGLETIRDRVRDALARQASRLRQRQILALLREEVAESGPQQVVAEEIQVGSLRLDPRSRQVWLNGRSLELTPTEFELLRCLASQPGRVLSSRELVEFSHGYELDERDARDLTKPHLTRLRAKLRACRRAGVAIHNVRGQGYRLDATGYPSTSSASSAQPRSG